MFNLNAFINVEKSNTKEVNTMPNINDDGYTFFNHVAYVVNVVRASLQMHPTYTTVHDKMTVLHKLRTDYEVRSQLTIDQINVLINMLLKQ